MSVVGFDIGYQSCYVAIARHGGVEVIANEYSDRRSPTIVTFGEKQRMMGISAKNQHIMNFKNTLYGFKVLLGRKYSDPFVQNELKMLPFEVVESTNDKIGIKVKYSEGERVFTPEQVTAMMLTYLKSVAEKALGKPVVDCVVSVPSYFCDSQRRAFLDACSIAGLNCLRLLNETTAVSLAYGIYKQDLPGENEKPRNVAFVDMGHSALQVSICSFQKGRLKVLSKSCVGIGGRDLDRCLFMRFAEDFKKKYKIDSLARPKQMLRLLTECEKVKKVMSTVTNPQTLSIECFADDKDVTGKTSREEFNEMCADLMLQMRNTLEVAIARSGLTLADLDSVEVVGGSCRVPMVKEVITDVFKREINTTLNLDEAVARGCCLQCAILSPSFKVRDFSITDTQPYSIKLRWQAAIEGEEGEMIVFKPGDAIYHSKVLTFYRKQPFSLHAEYAEPANIPVSDPRIGSFFVKDVVPTAEGEASKVKVKVRMNIHGVFFLKSATMIEKLKPEEVELPSVELPSVELPSVESMDTSSSEPKSEEPAEGAEDVDMTTPSEPAPADEGEKMDTPTEGMDQDPGTEGTDQGAGTSSQDSDSSPNMEPKADANTKVGKEPETKKPKKPTIKQVDLPIDEETPSLRKTQLTKANEAEVNMKYQDQLEAQRTDSKNAVEEYVYSMREKLESSLSDFISESDKDSFRSLLTSTEDWLYEEGEDQPKKVYVERLSQLQKLGAPIEKRHEENEGRPGAFDQLGSKIVHFEKILVQYDSGDEVFNHIEGTEMDKVREQVAVKREWLNTNMAACHSLPKSTDPSITCAQIRAELKLLETACQPIVSKPKPKVEPPKDESTPKEEEPASEEATKEGEKMEEDPQPTGDNSKTDDMDLD